MAEYGRFFRGVQRFHVNAIRTCCYRCNMPLGRLNDRSAQLFAHAGGIRRRPASFTVIGTWGAQSGKTARPGAIVVLPKG